MEISFQKPGKSNNDSNLDQEEEKDFYNNNDCYFSPFSVSTINKESVNKHDVAFETNKPEDLNIGREKIENVIEDKENINEEKSISCLVKENASGSASIGDGDEENHSSHDGVKESNEESVVEQVIDDDQIEEDLNHTYQTINLLKKKLEMFKEQKDVFKSLEISFKFDDEINDLLNLDKLKKVNKINQVKCDKSSKEINRLNLINCNLTEEVNKLKDQLEIRTKQLGKATNLLNMTKKGLLDRGAYIKMLLEDNKQLRQEIKLAMIERKTVMEQFADEFNEDEDGDYNDIKTAE